jgi:hypothetical protein
MHPLLLHIWLLLKVLSFFLSLAMIVDEKVEGGAASPPMGGMGGMGGMMWRNFSIYDCKCFIISINTTESIFSLCKFHKFFKLFKQITE